MKKVRARLPKDAAALALGADRVADALKKSAATRGIELDLVRTGSRGMVWLEPLLEIETDRVWRAASEERWEPAVSCRDTSAVGMSSDFGPRSVDFSMASLYRRIGVDCDTFRSLSRSNIPL